MELVENKTFDQERALYGTRDLLVRHCQFDGHADEESALKECRDITVQDCFFNLRYPFWHYHNLIIAGSELTPLCRAALWYTEHAEIRDSKLHGIKADVTFCPRNLDGPHAGCKWRIHTWKANIS